MYAVRVYSDDDVLKDIVGNFDTEEQADEWIRNYVADDDYAVLVEVSDGC